MLSLKQTQWFYCKIFYFNGCLFQNPLYNLKRACIHGTFSFSCNSFTAMRTRSRNKKQNSKKVKLKVMAALTNSVCNKALSKTESTKKRVPAEQRGGCNNADSLPSVRPRPGTTRSKPKESITSGKESDNEKYRSNKLSQRCTEVVAPHVNNICQPASNQNIPPLVNSQNCNRYVKYQRQTVMCSNSASTSFQASHSMSVVHPPSVFFRSFSDSRIQQQHLNLPYLNKSGPTYNHSNRNPLRRSSTADSTNRTTAADRDRQLAWALRSWQRTPFGKTLGKKRPVPLSCSFTVMSYNVLAQELLTEHSFLYRNHQPRALLWEQRWNNLLEEIKQHNADILCLQEVQTSHIEDYFNELKKLGYQGIFKQRTGIRTDGCAIYYKTSVFNLVEHVTVEFNQSTTPVLNRDNVAIIAKFAPKHNQENEFVVATTHLLYNPKREDVRLAQTQVLLSEVDRIAFKRRTTSGFHEHLPIIITGDFNLTPDSSVYELIIQGMLQYENLTNRSLSRANTTAANSTGKFLLPSSLGITDQCQHAGLVEKRKESITLNRDDELEHIHLQHTERYMNNKSGKTMNRSLFSTGTLSHDLALKSAYGHRFGGDMEATTYQDRWITVDYIFYSGIRDQNDLIKDDKLKLVSRYTIPTRKQLQGVRIPNFAFGSDHLSLVVKFQLDP